MRETEQEGGGGGGDQIQKSEKDQVRRLSEKTQTLFLMISLPFV